MSNAIEIEDKDEDGTYIIDDKDEDEENNDDFYGK